MTLPSISARAVVPLDELRTMIESSLLEECQRFYGARLISLVVYGSVGRGTFSPASDLDLLIIADPLPKGRIARVREFEEVESGVGPDLARCRSSDWDIRFSPILKTPAEAEAGSPLFLDMVDDARILFDRAGFFSARLDRLRERLRQLGSRRIWKGKMWYWDLKPDWKPGDVIEL
jgi:uncharacterized protein